MIGIIVLGIGTVKIITRSRVLGVMSLQTILMFGTPRNNFTNSYGTQNDQLTPHFRLWKAWGLLGLWPSGLNRAMRLY